MLFLFKGMPTWCRREGGGWVRLRNVPETPKENPEWHDSTGRVWSETGDVSETFLMIVDVLISSHGRLCSFLFPHFHS